MLKMTFCAFKIFRDNIWKMERYGIFHMFHCYFFWKLPLSSETSKPFQLLILLWEVYHKFNLFFYRSYEYCNFIYKKHVKAHLLRGYLPGDPPIPEQMFCAGSNSDPNIRTERGDSGGPVFVKTRYLNIILLLF